jgi:hypothetical protein
MNQPVHHQPESPSDVIAGVTVCDVQAQDHTGAHTLRCVESVEAAVTPNSCGWCLGAHPITACPWGARLVAFVVAAMCRPLRVWA